MKNLLRKTKGENIMKNVKGITLIALVVTIIVLLILAAVSINIAVNGGIIGRAKQSTTSYSASKGQEELQLKLTEYKMDAETGTVGDLKTYLEGNGADAVEEDGDNLDVTYQGYVYTVNKTNMSIEGNGVKAGPRPSTSIVVKDGSGNTVTTEDSIKQGSTLTINISSTFAEGTITGISQKNADGSTTALTVTGVNTGNASTTLNVTTNGSYSFVISYKLTEGTTTGTSNKTLTVNQFESAATATTVEGAIAEGKYYDKNTAITDSSTTPATVTVPAGFKIASDSATTVAGGVVIEDQNSNQYVWIPVATINDYSRKSFKGENITTTYTETMPTDEQTSVKTNKGYYIGRYEAGNESSKAVVKKGISPYLNVTRNTAIALSTAVKTNNNYTATTKLCSSYAWDTALKFIDASTTSNYSTNSQGGNYSGSVKSTGSTTAVCNIYDMGGNVYEFTTETTAPFPCVSRGGGYSGSATGYPAGSRYSYSTSVDGGDLGFRVTLYL